jgi:4'-phosphopantetheinyl transferase
VGIDVESIGRYKDSLAEYTMNASELRQIQEAACPEEEFIRLWTMKEAVLKLSGVGISNEIKDVLSMPHKKYTTVVHPQQRYIYTVCQDEV